MPQCFAFSRKAGCAPDAAGTLPEWAIFGPTAIPLASAGRIGGCQISDSRCGGIVRDPQQCRLFVARYVLPLSDF
jgi:hypothetical protein